MTRMVFLCMESLDRSSQKGADVLAEDGVMHATGTTASRAFQQSKLLNTDEVLPMNVIERERIQADRDLSG